MTLVYNMVQRGRGEREKETVLSHHIKHTSCTQTLNRTYNCNMSSLQDLHPSRPLHCHGLAHQRQIH